MNISISTIRTQFNNSRSIPTTSTNPKKGDKEENAKKSAGIFVD